MRVLHVTPYFAPAFAYGGPPRSILGLCRALQAVGVGVQVFTTTANGTSDLPASGAHGDFYDEVPVHYFQRALPRRFFGATGVRRALAAAVTQYDLFHIHGLWNLPAWTAAQVARRCGVPYVLSPRGMLEPGALALRSARKRIAYPLIERRNLEGAALLHATGAPEARRLAQRQLGVEIVTLPNGIDLPADPVHPRGSWRGRLGLDSAPLVVFLGRIHPIKRLDLLAAAFDLVCAARPQVHLVMAGPNEDDHRSVVEPLFAGCHDHVHWIGEVDPAQRSALLADADVLVLCSSSENFGMSVAEALAASVPVVATRTCPWEDIETHGCGFWVESEAAAVADAVVRILDDPALAREMGMRGRALIRDQYSWPAIGRAMADHYAAVARRRRVAGASA
jgi:glycosyltransferase involved in cell wall biosynthesis